MMLGLLKTSHIFFDALPEFVLGSLHELIGNLGFVALPIVFGHIWGFAVTNKL